MPGEASDILRLHNCPKCGYDLGGLPRNHQCPECGTTYYHWMFDLPAWWGTNRGAKWLWLPSGIVGLLITAAAIMGSANIARFVPCMLISAAVLTPIVQWLTRAYRKVRGTPELYLLIDHDCLAVYDAGRHHQAALKWKQCRLVKMTKVGRMKWRLVLKPRWPQAAYVASLNLLIACDRRQAAVVRNQLRRRVADANRR